MSASILNLQLIVLLVLSNLMFAGSLAVGQESEAAKLDAAIDSGVRYLISKQSDADGAWHSEYYGSMKQGAATTGLVVYSLSHLPREKILAIEKSVSLVGGFVKRCIAKDGAFANADGSLDYPVYATAMILSSSKRLKLGIAPNDCHRMIEYLLNSQCKEQRGFATSDVNFGGWDILGSTGPEIGKTPGANVSVTFYVTEALSEFPELKPDRTKKSMNMSLEWAKSIARKSEGNGFYFSATERSPLNKAGISQSGKLRSYGTATLDGMGILLNCGLKRNGQTYLQALEWLNRNQQIAVPGFGKEGIDAGWPEALQFYYFAACSRTIDEMRNSEKLKAKIMTQLLSLQKEDGSWQNPFANMREDDPLIATSYAVIALCNLRE